MKKFSCFKRQTSGKRLGVIVCLAFLFLSQETMVLAQDKSQPESSSNSFQENYESSLNFALNVFQNVVADAKPDENVVVSPLGFYRALEATSLGASGETKTEIDAVLKGAIGSDDWRTRSAAVFKALKSGDELSSAGCLLTKSTVGAQESYVEQLRALRDDFTVFNVEGDADSSVVNDWVEKKTNGSVRDFLTTIEFQASSFIVVDAISFQGKWKEAFNPDGTRDDVFCSVDSKLYLIPVMHTGGKFRYCERDGFQYVELDYQDGRYTMALIAPSSNSDYQSAEKKLNAREIADWNRSAPLTKIGLSLPKFNANFKTSLKAVAEKMGVRIAFDERKANFAALTGRDEDGLFYLSQILQNATLNVDEQGTEARVATSSHVTVLSAPPLVEFCRPFIYFIRENSTGQIAFIGRMVKPVAGPNEPPLEEYRMRIFKPSVDPRKTPLGGNQLGSATQGGVSGDPDNATPNDAGSGSTDGGVLSHGKGGDGAQLGGFRSRSE
ncbi:MAG: serpin family protein [Thermoguttaceae bacterium]|nr:serpin family protein [Thermoguttaceae bacterium]